MSAGVARIEALPPGLFDALVRHGEPVRAAKEAAGLSLDEIVERSGLTASRIAAFESGRDAPTLGEADALGRALAVAPDFFIGDAD